VNAIKGFREEVKEPVIVQKRISSLPMIFGPNISALEEREDLGTISMDELHGIFTTYEIKIKHENPSKKESTFKASKKTKKNNKHKSKSNCNSSDDSDKDEEIANFVRKLKRETDKYKGILPLRCFNYDKIDHFENKFSNSKKSDSDEEEDPKKENKYQKGNKKGDKRKVFKK
jgi:hypothetical protein